VAIPLKGKMGVKRRRKGRVGRGGVGEEDGKGEGRIASHGLLCVRIISDFFTTPERILVNLIVVIFSFLLKWNKVVVNLKYSNSVKCRRGLRMICKTGFGLDDWIY
jgi:hypothetical protein